MTRQKVIPEDLATRLWDVAPEVLAPQADLTISAVSARTGIPRATLYYYFAGQSDLAEFYADHLVGLAADAAAKAAAEPGTVPERLRRALLAVYDPPRDFPLASATLLTVLGSRGDLIPKLIGFRQQGFDVIRDLLIDGMDDGSLRPANVDVSLATIFGALEMVALGQLTSAASIDVDSVMTSIDILMRGLSAAQ